MSLCSLNILMQNCPAGVDLNSAISLWTSSCWKDSSLSLEASFTAVGPPYLKKTNIVLGKLLRLKILKKSHKSGKASNAIMDAQVMSMYEGFSVPRMNCLPSESALSTSARVPSLARDRLLRPDSGDIRRT